MNGFLPRILVTVTVFVSAAVLIERRRTELYRSEFESGLEALVREGVLAESNAFVREFGGLETPQVAAHADELELRLDRATSTPGSFDQLMVAVEEQLDLLLALHECVERLDSARVSPMKTRVKLGEPLRNALWARAFTDAAKRGDSTGAVLRFARYLDLQHLSRAYTQREYEWQIQEARAWLDSFAQLAVAPALDASAVFAAIDARLERAAAGQWYRDALAGEFGGNFRQDWKRIGRQDSDFERVWHQVGALEATLRSVAGPCLDPTMPPRRRGRLDLPFDYGPTHEFIDMERAAHPARRALTLARVALALRLEEQRSGSFPRSLDALAVHFGGSVPVDPCTRSPFAYSVLSTRVELTLAPWPHSSDSTHVERNGWKHSWSFPVAVK